MSPRDVSLAFRQAFNAQSTEEGVICLVTITHPDMQPPLYLTNAGTNVESRGNTYLFCPFEANIVEESPDRPPQAKFRLANVDRRLVVVLRSFSAPCNITVELVRISDPNTVEAAWTDFLLKEVQYDAIVIEGVLTLEGIFHEPEISWTFSPSYFPGLF